MFKKLLLTAAMAVLIPLPAFTQEGNCAPRDRVLEGLTTTYGETRQSMGLGSNNLVVEMFASEETGSWTITATSPDGQTCMVASGLYFTPLSESLPPEGIDG